MTSIEYLDDQLQEYVISVDHVANTMVIKISFEDYMYYKRKAEEIHKKEIIDSHLDGQSLVSCKDEYAEQYYQETFKQPKKD